MISLDIDNLYHCVGDNIGDLMCGPGQYLWPEYNRKLRLKRVRKISNNVILGGGQIFSQLDPILSSIYRANPEARPVAWGVGLPPLGSHDDLVREVGRKLKIFGTRNYDRREQLDYVPCASCLSPLFDDAPSPQHEVVFYLHRRKGEPIEIPEGAPVLMNTNQPPKEVVDFIASGEIVVTNSYHGVYWSQLLGRKVICLPYSNKFEVYEHRPTMVYSTDWASAVKQATKTPPLLEEYRTMNYAFAERVLALWAE